MRLPWFSKATKRAAAPTYTAAERVQLRAAGAFNARLLDYLRPFVVPGATTEQLDDIARIYTLDHGHTPACLGYKKYPKTICTSVNDVVCHGIPGRQVLRDSDIVNIDATTIVDGFFGDSSEMFLVGNPSTAARQLVTATLEAMWVGIDAAQPYGTVYEVGRAITLFARRQGWGVVREYQGHGVGRVFHTEPGIPHYPYKEGMQQVFLPGMCFTIEPMLNAGTWRTVKDKRDGWTVRTKDRRLSAQFEHMIFMTEDGPEVLTQTQHGPRRAINFKNAA